MEKINKIRVSLISIIVIFLIATIFTLLLTSLWKFNKPKLYTSAYTTREIWKYPCLIFMMNYIIIIILSYCIIK